jgi:hypothetical protein
MHPELIAALATEHRRDLAADVTAHAVPQPRRPHVRLPRLPHYRLTWTHTSIGAAAAGSAHPVSAGRGERSWVIVISATRGL